VNAPSEKEIVFTRNATEAMNLLARSLVQPRLKQGDTFLTTITEHHANFVPWQQACHRAGVTFQTIGMQPDGRLEIIAENGTVEEAQLERYITPRTRFFAFTAVSNVLGTANPVPEIIAAAKRINPDIIVIVDAAQAVPHQLVDVQAWGADAIAFSAHKMLGSTGTGVLWAKMQLLEKMEPYQYGGDMISSVAPEASQFREPPYRFEAGTPHIAGVIALKPAIEYLRHVGLAAIAEHERHLARTAAQQMQEEFGGEIQLIGPAPERRANGILSFTIEGVHPHDAAQILADQGIAVRAGHHCAMPLHTHLNIPASIRAGFYLYNTEEDVAAFITGLKTVVSTFRT
jgi:cysteine desulfurase/selenocysteine lyase